MIVNNKGDTYMFIIIDGGNLINTRYIRDVEIDGMKLIMRDLNGECIGTKTFNHAIDAFNALLDMFKSEEAMAIDRLTAKIEQIEAILEDIKKQQDY